MKRLIIMLLIASSALSTTFAQKKDATWQKARPLSEAKYPTVVRGALNDFIQHFALAEGQSYSVNRNPVTDVLESSERVVRFRCDTAEPMLQAVKDAYNTSEYITYQFTQIMPGGNEQFAIRVVSDGGKVNKTIPVRTKNTQEMWFLATKNLENPQLRDVYAIVWEKKSAIDWPDMFEGTIYMISSLRPDLYTKEMDSSKKTFRIEGRVDANIKDSLYNIYIADTYAQLCGQSDDAYVACVPVINKRFEYQVELDHPVAGRLRCIFPDGELCSAWIDLDFVPGETYHITVHNGYYDDDMDYERRVGRFSGKSLIRSSATVDEPRESVRTVSDPMEQVQLLQAERTKESINKAVEVQLKFKANKIEVDMKILKVLYEQLDPAKRIEFPMDLTFDQILNKNKTIESDFADMIKLAGNDVISDKDKIEFKTHIYKKALELVIEQNKILSEASRVVGFPKSGRKLQTYLEKLSDKYMNALTKLMR
jgi:hypothetical protein